MTWGLVVSLGVYIRHIEIKSGLISDTKAEN
jgi:hypothetical protein